MCEDGEQICVEAPKKRRDILVSEAVGADTRGPCKRHKQDPQGVAGPSDEAYLQSADEEERPRDTAQMINGSETDEM